ncbi:MAG: hypothetical protein ACOCX9_05365 [Spirochaetota bacterium]
MLETIQDIKTKYSETRQAVEDIKGNLGTVFGELSEFLRKTSERIEQFTSMISPYVNYFYPDEAHRDENNFINDVVYPSQSELNGAIDRAVTSMQGDARINNTMEDAIKETLTLKDSVDTILDVVESIEIYSANTMIISIKAGEEGHTLTKIAEEMSQLSGMVADITEHFTGLSGELAGTYTKFRDERNRIELIHENYLTQMKLSINMIMKEMISELDSLTDNVHSLMGMADNLNESLGEIINRLQLEDVVRQDLEKMIYITEEINNTSSPLWEHDDTGDIEELVAIIAYNKMNHITSSFDFLLTDIRQCFDSMNHVLDGVVEKFNSSEEQTINSKNYEKMRLDRIYDRMEQMKNDYIDYIKKIIQGKTFLLDLSYTIQNTVLQFNDFFTQVAHISRRFEIINMLTRIELARHTHLQRAIGGALSDVSQLPKQIKGIVEESHELYLRVRQNMDEAINAYSAGFSEQEKTLNGCVESMRKVSVKLYESQKYYMDISQQVEHNVDNIKSFIDSEEVKLGGLEKARNNFVTLNSEVEGILSSEVNQYDNIMEFTHRIAALKEFYKNNIEQGNYRTMMIISLLNEFEEKTEENVILFQE